MLEITCCGSPYEIGFQHGSQAKELVHGSIEFYEDYFQRMSKMSWATAEDVAMKFRPFLEQHVPHLVEEMQGIADGAGVSLPAVFALNARTEISMGMMDDGCTSLAWKGDDFSVAGQNWDWEAAQKARLVILHIKPNQSGIAPRAKISLATEAGLLSKSGLNSHGVAVFVNAIKAAGVKFDALPIHIALRTVLDCESRLKAIARLLSLTLGTSGHIMIADKTGGTSLEFSHLDIIQMEMANGQIAHTNHFLAKHDPAVKDSHIFPDSITRQKRIMLLLEQARQQEQGIKAPAESFEKMLEDEEGFPTAINRKSSPIRQSETLYSFVADLNKRTARLRLGRPNECEGVWEFKPVEL
ncbi:unnamed protein product [Penicillium pancosmium]